MRLLKKNWFGLLSLTLSFGLLLFFLLYNGGYRETLDTIRDMKWTWLLAALSCAVLFWLSDAFLLYVFTRSKYKDQRFTTSCRTAMIGFLYNNLTPFATGGQPMQVVDMTQGGVAAGDASSYIMMKTIFYQTCLTLYAIAAVCFGFYFFAARIDHFVPLVAGGLFLNFLFVATVLLSMLSHTLPLKLAQAAVKLMSKLKFLKFTEPLRIFLETHLHTQITFFHASFRMMYQKTGLLAAALALTFFQLTVYFLLPYCLYRGFAQSEGSLALLVSAQAIVSMITAFIPMPGGAGAAESGFYLFFSIFFAEETVIPAIFIWRVITVYLCMLIGGLVIIIKPWKKKGDQSDGIQRADQRAS
jgi:uncharacterized protein (TIRG00374 family)